MTNPLLRDRDVEFVLYEVLDAPSLCGLEAFSDHSRETFDLYLQSARRLAREVLYPAYRAMDEQPPTLEGGSVKLHPLMRTIYPQLVELGVVAATRPAAVGGQQLPLLVASLAHAYLMAANLSAYGLAGLTSGAAHLIEAFGDEALRREFMEPLYSGAWTGTMALTEPQAGSSLADVRTRATPASAGHYLIKGSKIFISGGDHDLTENVVNLALARIDGAPPGIRGVSLFAVPKLRREGGALVPNDVAVAGVIHKIGWRGLPSLALEFGDEGDCHGYLVGPPNQGIAQMFQMMNEARIMVGMNAVATASVAFHEALAYAQVRPQGRALGVKDPSLPQVPIIEHADVRRMLLRQKAIVEGGLSLLATTARLSDLAGHAASEGERRQAQRLLDLLTPVAKSFPAERGFEANALALQVHGGYGYSSEFLPASWLRDQKLNSIHEGTTGIQGLDLLGRKAVAEGGAGLQALAEELGRAAAAGREAGASEARCGALTAAASLLLDVTARLGGAAAGGGAAAAEAMLRHSADYLDMVSTIAVSWQWLLQETAACRGLAGGAPEDRAFYEGKVLASQYWFATELPRIELLAALCSSGEDSYARIQPGSL
jgi:alkylation response protein AidB-like acyl-CoA dehydrogenase